MQRALRLIMPLLFMFNIAWAQKGMNTRTPNKTGDLHKVNNETQIQKVYYHGNETFPKEQLNELIATQAPTAWDRIIPTWLNNFLFRETRKFYFNPYELQKDLIRLQHFYNRNGFLKPNIVYNATLDETANQLKVLFNIREGDPLLIQEVAFYGQNGRELFYDLPTSLRPAWQQFRDGFRIKSGARFSELELLNLRDATIRWLQNQGYAFAKVNLETNTDSTYNFTDVNFNIQTKALCRFGKIEIQGLDKISRETVVKMLAFKEGDQFSNEALIQSKKRIFESSQFRVALYDIPPQPEDSTVEVRFRLRESKLRTVTGAVGLTGDQGLQLNASWEHRNFFGGARGLLAKVEAQPGSLLLPQLFSAYQPSQHYVASVSLKQPHLFIRNLTFSLTPFYEWKNDINVSNEQKYGVKSGFFYQFGYFQNILFQTTFQRVKSDGTSGNVSTTTEQDQYNKTSFLLSGTLGKIDNILLRSKGYLFKPFIELSGRPFQKVSNNALLSSGTNYFKLGTEATFYSKPAWFKGAPYSLEQMNFNGRLFLGKMWSADSLDQTDIRSRYSEILFFAGGERDVRGWRTQSLGPKKSLQEQVQGKTYQGLGGKAKIAGNLEAQFPLENLPGMRLLTFLDFGAIGDKVVYNPMKWQYGTGVGARFLFGGFMVGADLGIKLNPTYEDQHLVGGKRCSIADILSCGPVLLHVQVGQTF